MNKFKYAALLTVAVSMMLGAYIIQAKQQPQSPPASTETVINGKKITINYGSPAMRGRKIFGGLVPFGKVWRTGANKATALTTEATLVFGNVEIPAGAYTLWTLPAEQGWKLIINKQTGQWGTQYSEAQDLARVDMKVTSLAAPVEQFNITLSNNTSGGILKLDWETTSASVNFKVK